MVSRYHWVELQASGPIPNVYNPTLMNQTANIPAGGILKKVLLSASHITFKQKNTSDTGFSPFTFRSLFRITSGPNNNRIIYHGERRIPMVPLAYMQGVLNDWVAWHNAADLELGINEQMSYGKAGDPAWTVNALLSLYPPLGATENYQFVASDFTLDVRFLYYL